MCCSSSSGRCTERFAEWAIDLFDAQSRPDRKAVKTAGSRTLAVIPCALRREMPLRDTGSCSAASVMVPDQQRTVARCAASGTTISRKAIKRMSATRVQMGRGQLRNLLS